MMDESVLTGPIVSERLTIVLTFAAAVVGIYLFAGPMHSPFASCPTGVAQKGLAGFE